MVSHHPLSLDLTAEGGIAYVRKNHLPSTITKRLATLLDHVRFTTQCAAELQMHGYRSVLALVEIQVVDGDHCKQLQTNKYVTASSSFAKLRNYNCSPTSHDSQASLHRCSFGFRKGIREHPAHPCQVPWSPPRHPRDYRQLSCTNHRSTRGAPAGDPATMFIMGLVTIPLTYALRQQQPPQPPLSILAYVDDITMWTTGPEAAQAIILCWQLFKRWASYMSLPHSIDKTVIWATITTAQTTLRNHIGMAAKTPTSTKDLGVDLLITNHGSDNDKPLGLATGSCKSQAASARALDHGGLGPITGTHSAKQSPLGLTHCSTTDIASGRIKQQHFQALQQRSKRLVQPSSAT